MINNNINNEVSAGTTAIRGGKGGQPARRSRGEGDCARYVPTARGGAEVRGSVRGTD